MTEADIPVIFIDDPQADAWSRLQQGLGQGFATVIIETPSKRGHPPVEHELQKSRVEPVADWAKVKEAVSDLLYEWRHPFETIMNRRWDLYENVYAKAWLLPGAILLHEDPLGWVIDAQAEDMATGGPLDMPTWAILMPKAQSNHATMEHLSGTVALPHANILNAALDSAAKSEGHDALCPLVWLPQTMPAEQLDILDLER